MITITKEVLDEILSSHEKWLKDNDEGEKAYLSGYDLHSLKLHKANLYNADLSEADLCCADLSYTNSSKANLYKAIMCHANLSNINLHNADLIDANLRGVNLEGADLSNANLEGADLRGVNLKDANLTDANLMYTNLCGVDLSSSNIKGVTLYKANIKNTIFPNIPYACPEKGEFIAYKACRDYRIVKLLVPADAKRLSAARSRCRCDKAKVLSITSIDGTKEYKSAISKFNYDFIYIVGEYVSVDDFNDNRWINDCPGIYFFMDRKEAEKYYI